MQQRRFGTTDLIVSEVGFGCARLGGVFESDTRSDLLNTLRTAFDRGITFFDTADMYTQGESEKLLGEAFRGKRDRVLIASKAGYCLPAQKRAIAKIKPFVRPLIRRIGIKRESIPSSLKGTITQDFSASYLIAAVERSLKRLQTEYLDLYQLHSPPTAVLEQGEFLVSLEKLKSQGKIRYYGVSCETTQDAVVCLRYPGISSLQIRLSLLEQSTLKEVVPCAAERGIALIAREVFAGGMLAKPVQTRSTEESTRSKASHPEIEEYHRLAARFGRPLPQVALQFILGLESISVALLGLRTKTHLADNLHYMAAPTLSQEEMSALCEHSI